MGMYTQLFLASDLKKDTPKEVIDVLKYMLHEIEIQPKNYPFESSRSQYMLNMDSYYFDTDSRSTLRFDDISNRYYLNVLCNLKNYHGEIEDFLNWISPFLNKLPGDFLGYKMYEEDLTPTLIYYEEVPIATINSVKI